MSEVSEILGETQTPFPRAHGERSDFVCLATTHGEIFYLNPAARRWIGWEEDAVARHASLHDFYSDDSWRELRDLAVPAVNKSGQWEGRSRLRQHEDRPGVDASSPSCTASRCRRATGPVAWRSCIATPRRRTVCGRALSEAQARKNSILESSLDPIITINHEGVIIEFNRAAEQAFGHPREKVLGTRPSDVLFPPSLSAEHRNRIERYLEAGEGSMLGKRRRGDGLAGQRRGVPRRDGHGDRADQRRPRADVLRPRHQPPARRPKKSRPAMRPSWSGPTATWSSSPTWPRTTCRSRSARSGPSATGWR